MTDTPLISHPERSLTPHRTGIVDIRERIAMNATPPGVDMSARRIDNVSMLRETSRNGYRYSLDAMEQAVSLFDGARSFIDHGEHSVRDIAGKLHDLKLTEDERGRVVKASLSVVPGSAGDWLLEMADRMPDMLGLSIVARGRFETDESGTVVTELVRALSVDFVADPATTDGLFESTRARDTVRLPSPDAPDVSNTISGETRRLQHEARTDWLACLLAERLGDTILDDRFLDELENIAGKSAFTKRLIERLRLTVREDTVTSAPASHPPAALNTAGQRDLKEALQRALR